MTDSNSKHLEDYRQMERSDFTHFSPLSTRWGDSDAMGHINNVKYSRYFESARSDYFNQVLNLEFAHKMPSGVILADLKVAFIDQLHHPKDLEIGSRISRIGSSSLDMDSAIFIKGEDKVITTSRGVMVWFDFVANETKPVPDNIRQTLIEYEQIPPA